MSGASAGPSGYEPAYDGLRGLAVLAVVLLHVWPTFLVGGWIGVDIFFVISGFLITRNLLNEMRSTGRVDIGHFYLRRALRLVPALSMLLAFVLAVSALRPGAYDDVVRSVLLAASYTMNWSRAFGWWPEGILGHTWSLAIEEQFYLLWPVAFLLIQRLDRTPSRQAGLRLVVLLAVTAIAWRFALAASGASQDRLYNGFDTHCDGLLIGCLLAFLRPGPVLLGIARRTVPVPLACVAAWMFMADARGLGGPEFSALLLAAVGLSAWLLLAAPGDGWFRRALCWTPLLFTGRISYGLYLWHYPLLLLLKYRMPAGLEFVPAVLAYAVATASYLWFERPILRLKDPARWRSFKAALRSRVPGLDPIR